MSAAGVELDTTAIRAEYAEAEYGDAVPIRLVLALCDALDDADKRAKSWQEACYEEEARRKALEARITEAVDLLEAEG